MVLFAEVIAFFGTASLFAWLAFIVFQDEQLVDYKPPKDNSNFLWIERTRKAREHLFTVYDFFLISFLSYVASYVGDYLVHFQKK